MKKVFFSIFCLLLFGQTQGQTQPKFANKQIIDNGLFDTDEVNTADLDGDGDLDVLALISFRSLDNQLSDYIVWYKNKGQGYFGNPQIIAEKQTSSDDGDLQTADIDNDGYLDVILLSSGFYIHWYKNDGLGNFNSMPSIGTYPSYADKLRIGDINNDGHLDLMVARYDRPGIACLLNDGTGTFEDQIVIAEEISTVPILHLGDMDNDGDVDILPQYYNQTEKTWFENQGDMKFEKHTIEETTYSVVRKIVDFDGDGDMDLWSVLGGGMEFGWYENDGEGNFEWHVFPFVVAAGRVKLVVDLDQDGDMDFLGHLVSVPYFFWYENDGEGNFNYKTFPFKAYAPADFQMKDNSIRLADLDQDGSLDILICDDFNFDEVAWYRNIDEYTSLETFTFQDLNQNGLIDSGEPPLFDQPLLLLNTSDETLVRLNNDDNSKVYLKYGKSKLSYQPNPLWELTTSPSVYDIDITEYTPLPPYHFGFKPTQNIDKVRLNLMGSPTVCDTKVGYWVVYKNEGTSTLDGTITLEIDEQMELVFSNPPPDVIESQKLTWNITKLHPRFENKIRLQFQMPDESFEGELLESQASLQFVSENSGALINKFSEHVSELSCVDSPNDKISRSRVLGNSESVYINDTILYTIRFQNIGNKYASSVSIEDRLTVGLDWANFHPIAASHEYTYTMDRNTGLVEFYFDRINLPNSSANALESCGFVTFGITSLTEVYVEEGTKVRNSAAIDFAGNGIWHPEYTNTVVNTLVESDIVGIESELGTQPEFKISIRPNPFSDFTTIEVKDLPEGNYHLEVMDILGRKVLKEKYLSRNLGMENGRLVLKRGELESGVYVFRILKENNELVGSGKVLVE